MVSLRKQPSMDRSKIAMDREDEVKYWIKHFRTSSDDLQRIVEKVGNSASAVRKELRNSTLVKVTRTPDG
jgi:predicted double-glycine peptidase